MKTFKRWLFALCIAAASMPHLCFAQAPIVLSSADAPLVFELPLDASTTQSLTATTAVQLATRAQHDAQGMVYPDWLSDASFSVKNRPRQRIAIVVTPKRGNPELATELLLTLNNAGRRSFKPMHLIFDTLSSFAGVPATESATSEASASPAQTKPDLNVLLAPVIKFEGEPVSAAQPKVAITSPVPSTPAASANVLASQQAQPAPDAARARNALPALAKSSTNLTRQTAPSVATSTTTPAALAVKPAANAPSVSASVPAPLASSPAPALPPRNARPAILASTTEPGWASWFSNWPELLGGLFLLLAALYLLKRLLQKWRERRANQVQTNFLEPQPTQLAPEETGTNTVFGLSEEEANAMHARWLREQTAKRTV